MMTEETWSDVKGFEHYQISNLGRVRKISYLRPFATKAVGYPQVQLCESDGCGRRRKGSGDKGKCKKKFIHRLIAEAFIPNPDNKPFINHKDGDKSNFSMDNLEWVTASENCQHAYDKGLNKGGCSQQNRMVLEINNEGAYKIWKGIRELRACGHTWNKVYDSIRRGVHYKKSQWRYLQSYFDYNQEIYFLKNKPKGKTLLSFPEIEIMAAAEYKAYQATLKQQ